MQSRHKLPMLECDRLELEFGVDFDEFTLAHPHTAIDAHARSFVRDWLERRQLLDRVDAERFSTHVLSEAKGRHQFLRSMAQRAGDFETSAWLRNLPGANSWGALLLASVNKRRAHLRYGHSARTPIEAPQ